MREKMDEAILRLGVYGVRVGLVLIFTPIVWDILMIGVRHMFHWAICWKGILMMIVGALTMLGSWWIEWRTR